MQILLGLMVGVWLILGAGMLGIIEKSDYWRKMHWFYKFLILGFWPGAFVVFVLINTKGQ